MRLNVSYEEYENMTDEEIDAYYRPRKQNSRKSLLPLFVYLILKDHSNAEKPLRQQDIIEYLSLSPYELNVERKSISRVIHSLVDSCIGIKDDRKLGTWYAW